jgi:hypothetical protein
VSEDSADPKKTALKPAFKTYEYVYDGRGIFFQMTIRQGRKLQGSPIKESMRHLDANSAQLSFVTPKSIALNFDRQTISTGNKEEYKRKRNGPQIEQNATLIDPSGNDKYIS